MADYFVHKGILQSMPYQVSMLCALKTTVTREQPWSSLLAPRGEGFVEVQLPGPS